jgi:exonuclease SbcD
MRWNRVKLLHTADIHLREYHDERWEALLKLIEVGKQNNVDIFVVCGDLFDAGVDAESLRPHIREVFSNTGFKILILPGNHDIDSFKEGMYFGEDVFVLGSEPAEYGDMRVIGLPFEPIYGEQLLTRIRNLQEILTPDRKNILLCHGELLDAFFSRTCFGDEGEGRYMPFRLSYFDDLSIDYVLAGHFHSRFDVWQMKNGGYFVYPGSHVSITKSETGQRKVNIFELGQPPREFVVDTPHYVEANIELDPFKNDNPLEIVRESLETIHPQAKVILTIRGYIDSEKIHMSESDIVALSKSLAKGQCVSEPIYEFRDIANVLENSLFQGFTKKAMEAGYAEDKLKQLQQITIQAMMKAGL